MGLDNKKRTKEGGLMRDCNRSKISRKRWSSFSHCVFGFGLRCCLLVSPAPLFPFFLHQRLAYNHMDGSTRGGSALKQLELQTNPYFWKCWTQVSRDACFSVDYARLVQCGRIAIRGAKCDREILH
jgi:hypothetical protein